VQLKDLNELTFDEAWIGEHHSCGCERNVKLGTGMLSLQSSRPALGGGPDHPARPSEPRRAMLGLGPGALTKDAYRIGIDLLERRAPGDAHRES
jgi:alkanesulfonate monooxygenase SsuD/methylene tetrahydromethanopterin reductase-like flavin-dependent oxidoreductase (luciferase family)